MNSFSHEAQMSLGKMHYNLYSFCCSTDLKSSKVDDFHVIRKGVYDFLLVINSNLALSYTVYPRYLHVSHTDDNHAIGVLYSIAVAHQKIDKNHAKSITHSREVLYSTESFTEVK